MKKPGASFALLMPDAHGWKLRLPGGGVQSGKTIEDVAGTLSASDPVHLALPCNAALIERIKLPSTNREELAGMLQLQLEKTLPYPIEEASNDFDVIHQEENESTLLSISANNLQLDRLCEPLRNRARLPEKVTVYAMHVAATCPADQTVLCLWPEDGQLVAAICEKGKLSYAQPFTGVDATTLLAGLPAFLLSAEMEGAPTTFGRVRIEQGCAGLRDHVAEYFGTSVEVFSFDAPMPEPATNLVPPAWVVESRRTAQAGALKQRLQIAAALYLLLVAAAFIYLALQKRQVQKLDVQIAALQPQIDATRKQQERWQLLAPAIEPPRYAVEIVNLLFNSRPSKEVTFTDVEIGPTNFKVEGEAPNDALAVQFKTKLIKEPGLSAYQIDGPQPSLLPGGAARFVVYGKL